MFGYSRIRGPKNDTNRKILQMIDFWNLAFVEPWSQDVGCLCLCVFLLGLTVTCAV